MNPLPLIVNPAKLPTVTQHLQFHQFIYHRKVPQKMMANDKQYLQSAIRLIMARGQTSTAFRATALNNQSARFGAHANAEAMRLRTTAIIWLKCSFWHSYTSFHV